jgi:hypothetical protein
LIYPRRMYRGAKNVETVKDCKLFITCCYTKR